MHSPMQPLSLLHALRPRLMHKVLLACAQTMGLWFMSWHVHVQVLC
jgi:hypothetical protein